MLPEIGIYLHSMNNTMKTTNWKEVITFYVLACAFSWPFFAWRDLFHDSWSNSSVPSALRNLGVMWGPGLSAIVCFILFRKTHKRTISLVGTSLWKSLAFFLLPYAVWIILTLINPSDPSVNPKLFLMLIPFGFLMILGEELGWRGFLQDSLRNVKEWKRWVILGLMWEMWHFTRGLVNKDLFQAIVFKSMMILAVVLLTIIIGKLTDKTKSLLIAITLHSWVNIQFEFPHINSQIAGGISLIIWTFLIIKWNNKMSATTHD